MTEEERQKWRDAGIAVTDFEGADEKDAEYSMSLTVEQRWSELERMRQLIYGYNSATATFQRTLEIIERP